MKTRTFIAASLAVHARTITTPRLLIIRRAWLWTGFLAFAMIAFGPRPAQAAVTEAWVQRYGAEVGSGSEDSAHKVVTDATGNVIVAGSTDNRTGRGGDTLVIKYSGEGVPLWEKSYNGPADGDDVAKALAVDGSGNVVVTGYSAGTNNNYDYYTAKYAAADGALLWEKGYNGPANSQATAVAVDASGNVFVTGTSYDLNSNDDYYTAKYAAADGALLWEKRYNGLANGYDRASALAVDGSGNVFVTGSSGGSGGSFDYLTIAYSSAGVALWTNLYSGLGSGLNRASAVAVDGSGNVFVTGSVGSGSSSDYLTIAYSGAGVPLWVNRYNGPANGYDEARAMAVDGSGNVFVTGYSVGSGNGSDYATIAYSGAGVPLWTNRYNGPANGEDFASALAVDGSGNVVVTGESSPADYATIAYSGAGVPLWTNRYNGPANEWDSATAVAVDGSGNLFVTGSSYVSGGNWDYATIAYSGAGVPLWTNRYDGRKDALDIVSAMAVDGSGNVFVTGYSEGSGGGWVYATIAYSSTGVPLWTNRYNGPGNGYDQAKAVAVDTSGNVFVTGDSYDSGSGYDYATIAYSGAGVPLWTNRYNGPANSTDGTSALAVDASGNVFVTGTSLGSGPGSEYATIAYSGAGVPLWTNRYNGPGVDDQATAVAVDGSGNVFVTGSSGSGSGDYTDYATIAYSGAGVPLWTNRYNGPANGYNQASALAVDGSGNVVVTGSSDGDYYTAKYSGADGSVLWQQRYNNLGSGRATAVAVDGSGNVVVTGHSDDIGSDFDYYTAKYAAADGALLWEKRYDGPANRTDWANAVAVDGSGNVVVTGRTDGFNGMLGFAGGDYYTAKYAAADGATLWEKRFNRTWTGGPSPCLALGPNGMIVVSGTSSGDFATVVYRDVPAAVSIDVISAGVRVRFSGISGRTYNIERAPALTGPWSTINTQTTPASGLFEYLDTNPPAPGAFYRTSEQ